MKNTQEILDALRARAGSDRKAAALVGVSQTTFSGWRLGHNHPGDENARAMAAVLGVDPAYILAVIHGDRAKSDETRAIWQQIARVFGKAAAVACLAVGASAPSPAPAAGLNITGATGQGIHIASNRRRRNARQQAKSCAGALIAPLLWLVPGFGPKLL